MADAMSWIMEALCTYLCESFSVTSVEMPQATTLISFVCLCVVCTHCGTHQCDHKGKHMAPCSVFFFPEACLAGAHSIAGGRD